MAIAWPSGVPVGLLVVTPLKRFGTGNTLRTTTLSGRVKTRRMSTKTHRKFEASMMMTTAQLNTFDNWYHATLKDGSLAFQGVTNPRTGSNTVWLFLEDPEDANVPNSHNLYNVSMILLALPDAPSP